MFLLKGVAINSLELQARHKDENWWCGNQSGAALLRLAPPKRRKKMLLFLASGKFHKIQNFHESNVMLVEFKVSLLNRHLAYDGGLLGLCFGLREPIFKSKP